MVMKKFALFVLLALGGRLFALDIRGTVSVGDIGFGLGASPGGTYPELRINAVDLYIEEMRTGLGLRLSPYAFTLLADLNVNSLLNVDLYYNLLKKTNWFLLGPFAGINYINWDNRNHWNWENVLFTLGLKFVFRLREDKNVRPWDFAINLLTVETGYRYANHEQLFYTAVYIDFIALFFYLAA
jgi:hypothetical protein